MILCSKSDKIQAKSEFPLCEDDLSEEGGVVVVESDDNDYLLFVPEVHGDAGAFIRLGTRATGFTEFKLVDNNYSDNCLRQIEAKVELKIDGIPVKVTKKK